MQPQDIEQLHIIETEYWLQQLDHSTRNGKLKWKYAECFPTVHISDSNEDYSYYAQTFCFHSSITGGIIELEFTDCLYFHRQSGELFVSLSFSEYADTFRVLSLSDSITVRRNSTRKAAYCRRESLPIIKFVDSVLTQVTRNDMDFGVTVNNQILTRPYRSYIANNPTVALLDALITENKILDFHRCVLEKRYRNKLMLPNSETFK